MVRGCCAPARAGRRTVGAVLALLVLLPLPGLAAAAAPAADAGGDGEFRPGLGAARAQGLRVGPTRSGFNFTAGFSVSMAEYENAIARADSRFLDSGALVGGVIGAADDDEADPAEEQPSETFDNVRTDTRQEGAAEGIEQPVGEAVPDLPFVLDLGTQFVRATEDPFGEAITYNGRLGVEEAFLVQGGYTRGATGVVAEGVREARGESVFDVVAIADAVVIEDLRFEAVHRSGAEDHVDAGYTIGAIVVDGERFEAPGGDEAGEGLVAAFEQANTALEELGISLVAPRTEIRERTGEVLVSPLGIRYEASDATRSVMRPLLQQTAGPREALSEALLEQSDAFALALLFADVLTGPFGGAGAIVVEVGGARALTDAPQYADPFAQQRGSSQRPPSEGVPGSRTVDEPSSGDAGRTEADGGRPLRSEGGQPDLGAEAVDPELAAPPGAGAGTSRPATSAGADTGPGALLTVGLAVLLTGLALAGTDLLRVRRAHRTIVT
jgi:hypothetical protein